MRESARAVLINSENILVIFRRRMINGLPHEYYAFPGGGIENGETSDDCVVRELREETGIIATCERLFAVVTSHDSRQYIYICTLQGGNVGEGYGEELLKYSREEYQPMYVTLDQLAKIDNLISSLGLYHKLEDYLLSSNSSSLPEYIFVAGNLL